MKKILLFSILLVGTIWLLYSALVRLLREKSPTISRSPAEEFSSINVDSSWGGNWKLSASAATSGQLACGFYARHKEAGETSLSLLKFDNQGKRISTTYKFKPKKDKQLDPYNAKIIFDPQFSHDGRYVLFKFGFATEAFPEYHLYVLDTQTNIVTLASQKRLEYRLTSWSPDGKYIVYVAGGDVEAGLVDISTYIGPLRLFLCDWGTRKEYLITTNDTVRGPFNWMAPHTLVYGALSPQAQQDFLKQAEQQDDQAPASIQPKKARSAPKQQSVTVSKLPLQPRPNIYTYNPDVGAYKVLIKDGYRPTVSADGTQIAFFGSENVNSPLPLRDGWEDNPQGSALCVAGIDGSHRVALNREGGMYPALYWLPNNQELASLKQTRESPDARAEIRLWNVKTKRFKSLVRLSAKDFKEFPHSIVEPQFYPASFASAEQDLFIVAQSYTGLDNSKNLLILKATLYRINLTNGKVSTIAQANDLAGMDWHSETQSELKPSFSHPKMKE